MGANKGTTWASADHRRAEIIKFVREHNARYGYPPSLRETATAVGFRSISAVRASIDSLRGLGILGYEVGLSRSLHIINNDKADQYIAEHGSNGNADGRHDQA